MQKRSRDGHIFVTCIVNVMLTSMISAISTISEFFLDVKNDYRVTLSLSAYSFPPTSSTELHIRVGF